MHRWFASDDGSLGNFIGTLAIAALVAIGAFVVGGEVAKVVLFVFIWLLFGG